MVTKGRSHRVHHARAVVHDFLERESANVPAEIAELSGTHIIVLALPAGRMRAVTVEFPSEQDPRDRGVYVRLSAVGEANFVLKLRNRQARVFEKPNEAPLSPNEVVSRDDDREQRPSDRHRDARVCEFARGGATCSRSARKARSAPSQASSTRSHRATAPKSINVRAGVVTGTGPYEDAIVRRQVERLVHNRIEAANPRPSRYRHLDNVSLDRVEPVQVRGRAV
jgi:hypothetical protein